MAKLYVFGIGGTGSRVIRSLTMLLASGVKLENGFDTVVPLIIDPDAANGDLNRTTDILHKYQNIYKNSGEQNQFFGTKISTMKQLLDENVSSMSDHFIFGMSNTGQKFGEFIDYNGLDNENRALIDLLFSQANLEADMTVGFKGNPNIGSIVLNRFARSDEYREFSNSFNPGDGIFIINSIFGGTGASGFPLLLKNLRVNNADLVNSDVISRSTIGGVTFLPYFNIPDGGKDGREIDSSTFMSKSKAALSYYDHAIFDKDESLDAFYYLGAHSNNNVPYAEGKEDQRNPAHFLEMAGALAIVDFTKDFGRLSSLQGETTIKEFGIIDNQGGKVKFDLLGEGTKSAISQPLSKMSLLSKFLNKSLDVLKDNKGGFSKGSNGINQRFYNQDYFKEYLKKFLNYYDEWIDEMDSNDVSFSPFHNNQNHGTLMDFVKGKELNKSIFNKVGLGDSSSSGNHIISDVNKVIKSGKLDEETQESRFLKVFDEVIESHVIKILN